MDSSLYELRITYWKESYQRWVSEEFLSFPWIANIIFLFIVYVIWIKLVDRRRLKDILLFGSFIAVAAGVIDIIGVTIGLWEYKISLLPVSPSLFPFDYTIVPILYMIVLQYTSTWKKYLIGSLLAAAFNCFVINVTYVKLGILKYHKFNYFYMFLLIFVTTAIIKLIYNWISSIDQHKSVA